MPEDVVKNTEDDSVESLGLEESANSKLSSRETLEFSVVDGGTDGENDNSSESVVKYKKDNILLKSALWIFGGSFAILAILFVIGFIMGLSDVRPAYFDKDILQSKISELTGDVPADSGYNELDKNE